MSASVDVLAELDRRIAISRELCVVRDITDTPPGLADLIEARAAVAELIEAAAELRARQRDYLSQPKGERVEAKGRLVGVAATRLDAALARVGGA